MKSKKKLLGRYKSERESKWEPLGDHKEGHHRVIRNSRGQKRPFLVGVFEIKKKLLGRYKSVRESKWEPLGDHKRWSPPGDKKLEGSKKASPCWCF